MNRKTQGLTTPPSKPLLSFLLAKHKLLSHQHQLNAPALIIKTWAWNLRRALRSAEK